MELVNNKWIKMYKQDLFLKIVEYSDSNNLYMLEYFQELINTVLEYEKEHKQYINEIFFHIDNFSENEIVNIPIKRQTILNAYVFSVMTNQMDLACEIGKYLSKKEVLVSELGDLKNYILENSINIDEYYDGEKIRIIYNNQENKLEEGYIFNDEKKKIPKLK